MDQIIASRFDKLEALLGYLGTRVKDTLPAGVRRDSIRRPLPTSRGQPALITELYDGISTLFTEVKMLREAILHQSAAVRGTSPASSGETSSAPTHNKTTTPTIQAPPTHHTAEKAVLSPVSSEPPADPASSDYGKFFLSLDQMGEGMAAHLAEFDRDASFKSIVRMEPLTFDWAALKKHIPSKPNHKFCFVEWRRNSENGVSHLDLSKMPPSKWKLPDLSHSAPRPSDTEARGFLEKMASNPPSGPITYYVGPPLAPDFTTLLHPGEQLAQLHTLAGINTPYWHLGKQGSGTALHCEDADLRSYNFVVGPGYKIWLMIHDSDTKKFETIIRRRWKTGTCGQAIRHLNLFIAPSALDKEGVGYDIIIAGESDLIVTNPRQYHSVVNYSDCLAVAINFLHPGEPTFQDEVAVCQKCGLFSDDHPSFTKVPPPPGVEPSSNVSEGDGDADEDGDDDLSAAATGPLRPVRKRVFRHQPLDRAPKRSRMDDSAETQQLRSRAKALAALGDMVKEIQSVDPLCSIPKFTNTPVPSPQILKLASAIRSREAVAQLRALVESHRNSNAYCRPPTASPSQDSFVQCLRAIRQTREDLNLGRLHMCLYKLKLYDLVHGNLNGRHRAESELTKCAQEEAGCPRSTYFMYKNEGGQWRSICGPNLGIISLIPFDKRTFGLSAKAYLELEPGHVETLHSLLADNYARKLCSTALEFQASLQHGYPVEFRWESTNVCLRTCEQSELLQQLQPLPFTDINLWTRTRFNEAPTPTAWPEGWSWPCDPTMLLPTERQCDFCEGGFRGDDSCDCSNTVSTVAPRIKRYRAGRGLEAVACEAGEVAYLEGDFLGVVAGELYPLGTYTDADWTFDFHRPDIQGSPAVCQIRLEEVGNCFRLLIAAENPTARLVAKRRCGQWVMAVEAERDIRDGDQISVIGVPWSRSDLSHRAKV